MDYARHEQGVEDNTLVDAISKLVGGKVMSNMNEELSKPFLRQGGLYGLE